MTTMKMKSWVFERYGGPDVLQLRECPVPEPAADEVLIKVAASAINPSDVKNLNGAFAAPVPRVPGRDFSGIIVKGAGREGEAVWGSGAGFGISKDGTHEEYIVLPSSTVGKKPESLSLSAAASIGVPFLAAWYGLTHCGALKSGQTVLITGAMGAVGKAASQIARWKGARVVGAIREHPTTNSDSGRMVSTSDQNWAEQVREYTDGRGVDLILDTVGGPLFNQCLSALGRGGAYVVLASGKPEVTFNLVNFYHELQQLIGFDTMKLNDIDIKHSLDILAKGFDSGDLVPPDYRNWPFEQAPQAYQAVAKGTQGIKQILSFSGQ
ncbi:zinc-binding alcohol dehydrogenase family protein [Enterobacteriaceae bacterium BIT-l23]|jgi:NADPH2:quinone reductase|uniref:quinone oxidoreductase family protein n=1 Tax=Jejubacter sp. L23 TaxID=3092086 RepID=UPI0015847AB0|nr:zinc-binding alcohol dehydrogenase family protein [Enterobacteriaceae bacterium BIT-l23]